MTRRLQAREGPVADATDAAVARLLEGGEFFWLDVAAPGDADLALLHGPLGVAPIAHGHFDLTGRRPSWDDFDDFDLVTAYGAPRSEASAAERLVEVHCVLSDRFLVTLHRDPCPSLEEAAQEPDHTHDDAGPAAALHRVVDVLVESLLPVISDLDARGDELADAVLGDGPAGTERQILETRRQVIALRRIALPQRDMIGRLAEASQEDIPGMTVAISRRLRGDYERMVRMVDALDGTRDAAQAATDVYLGMVNNRLNSVMKQLTVLAGIFLPLTFLTGFFGQNFAWMVDHVTGGWAFALLGLALPVLMAAALWTFFRRRHWL